MEHLVALVCISAIIITKAADHEPKRAGRQGHVFVHIASDAHFKADLSDLPSPHTGLQQMRSQSRGEQDFDMSTISLLAGMELPTTPPGIPSRPAATVAKSDTVVSQPAVVPATAATAQLTAVSESAVVRAGAPAGQPTVVSQPAVVPAVIATAQPTVVAQPAVVQPAHGVASNDAGRAPVVTSTAAVVAANASSATHMVSQTFDAKPPLNATINATASQDLAAGNATSLQQPLPSGFLVRHEMSLTISAAISFCVAGSYARLDPEKRQQVRQACGEKPCTWVARIGAFQLMGMFAVSSLPWIGFLLDGCFFNALNGLFAVLTLAATALPQTLELLGSQAPGFLPASGLRSSASLLGSSGVTGLGLAISTGSSGCAEFFLQLSVALLLDAAIFAWAWWRGEGGGLMGLLR